MAKVIITFSDGASHDASVTEVSGSIEICHFRGWSLIPVSSGLDAAPTYTIEVSNDDINYAPYEDVVVDAAITQGFDDDHFQFSYVRINYDAQSNTTGTVSFTINFKP